MLFVSCSITIFIHLRFLPDLVGFYQELPLEELRCAATVDSAVSSAAPGAVVGALRVGASVLVVEDFFSVGNVKLKRGPCSRPRMLLRMLLRMLCVSEFVLSLSYIRFGIESLS